MSSEPVAVPPGPCTITGFLSTAMYVLPENPNAFETPLVHTRTSSTVRWIFRPVSGVPDLFTITPTTDGGLEDRFESVWLVQSGIQPKRWIVRATEIEGKTVVTIRSESEPSKGWLDSSVPGRLTVGVEYGQFVLKEGIAKDSE